MGKRKSKRQKPKPRSKVRRTNPPGDANRPDDEPIPLNMIEPTLLLEAPSVQEATCRKGTRVEDATIGEGRRDEDAAIGEETRVGEEETQVDDGGAYVSDRDREAISEDDCEVQSDTDLDIEEENCDDIRQHFGVDEKDDEDASDVDSGDDINWDDEKIPEPLSCSEDEEEVRDEDAGDVDPLDPEEILKLGKCFNTTEEFKLAVLRYSLKTRYDVKLYRSEQSKIGAKCTDTDSHCPWKCYASYERRKHKMQIKIYVNVHTCVRSGYSKMLKQGTIAWLFQERLRMNPKLTKQEMATEVQREYNLVVSEEKCAKAKTQLAKERKQSHEDHFARVWDYQAEIFQSNPDSTFEIETIPGPSIGSKQRFFRLYICFKAQREAWKQTCRPIIGIDGAFLRWDIKGHLLAAVGRDGDNRIVPLAWAVVEIENDINWDWFVRLLSVNLSLEDGSNVAIISDKQKVCYK